MEGGPAEHSGEAIELAHDPGAVLVDVELHQALSHAGCLAS
jgi:hypothetical protein